jgi:hypothetical protein
LLLASCATRVENLPTLSNSKDVLPTRLEFTNEAYMWGGGSTRLVLENGRLLRRTHHQDVESFREWDTIEAFTPTDAQWRQFRKALDDMDVWSWKSSYEPSDVGEVVMDGEGWILAIGYPDRSVSSSGANAGPDPKDYRKTVLETPGQLYRAVRILTAEKPPCCAE